MVSEEGTEQENEENNVGMGFIYKNSLMGPGFLEPELLIDIQIKGFISEDDEEEEDREEDCPIIRLTLKDKKKQIREPWLKTLIVKAMGRRVEYLLSTIGVWCVWLSEKSF